jgi:hypothetical protein
MFIKSLVVTTVIGLSSLPLSACMDTGDRYNGLYDDFYGAPFFDDGNLDVHINDRRDHHDYGSFSHQEGRGGHEGYGMGSSGHGRR